jgi:hypothetical protein
MTTMERVIKILTALQMGKEIRIGPAIYVYVPEERRICVKGVRITDSGEEEIYLGNHFSLDGFIQECEKLSERSMSELMVSIAFQKHKESTRKDRG